MQPLETELLKKAKKLGRSVHYGKYMIENQIDLLGNFLDLCNKNKEDKWKTTLFGMKIN